MTTYNWNSAVNGYWSTNGDWSPAGPVNAATADAVIALAGSYTVTIATTDSFLVDSLTFDPAGSGVLNLNGTLTLGGLEAEMTESSGTVNLFGTIAGGTLALTGGVLNDTGAGVITSAAFIYGGGTVTVASGKTLTFSGPVTLDTGAQIDGPGTLATTGTTSIIGTSYLDGGLVWKNSGTVLAGAEIYTGYPSFTGNVTINNQAAGAFDLTADGQAFYVGSTLALSNAGVLSKTGGTGTSNIANAITNTGTLTATSGTLELDGGGTLGGTVTETATGAVTLGQGVFALTGTVNGAGTLTVDPGATLSIGTAETIADAVVLQSGTVTIASGKTLTLSGPVTMDGDYIDGPGTLATTGATSITVVPYLDGSLTWNNTGTVSAGVQIYTGYPSGTGKVTINNLTGGAFDLTADGQAFYVYPSSTLALSNAGVLSKTGGTGISNISVAFANTGTVTATSGTLELDGGGTLGGTVTETATGAVTLGVGVFALTGTVNGAGTLTVDTSATLSIGTAETIADAVVLQSGTVTIASGKTLTLSGPVTMDGDYIDGPGTLATTGATTVTAIPYLDGSLTWNNTGTVSAGVQIYTGYPSGTGMVTINNQAAGAFDLTADGQAFYVYPSSTLALSNAGVLSKTGGTGTSNIANAITNTGTLTATSGTLELDGGGTLGGTVTETATGAVTLGAGVFALTGTVNGAGTLTVDTGATLSIGTAETIANPTVLEGTVTIASGKTLTLSGPVTMDGDYIDGPGTLATTGATTVTVVPYLDGSLTWNNSGTVSAGAEIYTGYPSGTGIVTINNQAAGAFNLTADGQAFNVYSTLALSNAGVLSKTGGTGTSYIANAITNTGTLTATSGTLELDGGGTLSGTVTETATGAVTLGEGVFALTGTVNGAGTLTVDIGATLSIGTAETIADAIVLQGGTVTIASGKTLKLSGPVTMDNDYIDGPGTLATTGATSVTVTPFLDGSLTWNNTGTVSAGEQIYTGYPSGTGMVTINNQAGGAFDLTADDEAFYVYGNSTLALSNAGVLSKTGGTGTSNISLAFANTGTVTATSGTLELDGGGTLSGVMGATGAGALALGAGTFTQGGTTQTISGALLLDGGSVDVASGQTLTLSGSVTMDGSNIDGPGTLVTTGATDITSTTFLDASLVWVNSGTVTVANGGYAFYVSYPSYAGTVTIDNLAGGVFDITAASAQVFYSPSGIPAIFSNAGLLEGTGTNAVTFGAILNSTGSVFAGSGDLDVTGGGTLGGSISIATGAELTFGGGTFDVTGSLTNNGTLEFAGGSASFAAAHETITSQVLLDGGSLDIGAGQTVTLSGAVTMDGSEIEGPGTLVTTGATDVTSTTYLDGSLVWVNSGTVTVADSGGYAFYADYPSYAGTVTIDNLAGGVFDLAGAYQVFYTPSGIPAIFSNAGLLEATGSSAVNFDAILNSTGSVLAGSGDLDLTGGGTLGGSISIAAGAELTFGGGTFDVTGSLTDNGTLEFSGGSVSFAATHQTITGPVLLDGGALDIASGQTVTLSGAVTMDGGGAIDGPGTLVTTGATDVTSNTYLDGSLVWVNSGTVTVADSGGYAFYVDYPSGAGTVTIDNLAGGVFDLTGAYQVFYTPYGIPAIFSNAGLLEATGTSAVGFDAILNSTGSVLAGSGDLDLTGGGTLGGSISITAEAELTFGGGAFEVTGSLTNNGTLEFAGGSASFAAAQETIADQVLLDGGALDIAAGQTVTLTGAVTMTNGGEIEGPGTLVTTGATDITSTMFLDVSLVWVNSGTVTVADSGGYAFYVSYPSGAGTVTIDNLAGGVFDIASASQGFYTPYGIPAIFNNAGLLEQTAGTGIDYFEAILNSTGTITATSGTLDLEAGGTLNGTIGGTGSGVVWLDAGGAFVTTGALAVLDAGTSNDLRLVNGATLTDSGRINDSGHFEVGNGSGASALLIAAGASFDFTTNDGQIVNGVSGSLSNAGTLAKIGGTGTSTVGLGFVNTGTVDAASGTLRLAVGLGGGGRLQIEAGDTLELGSGAVAASNTVDFNGLGATLKIDTNSTVIKPIIGLGGGSRVDLAAASSVAAVINGNTLTITPAGGSALNFVSTSSLANLHITTGSDGGTGTVVTLYNEAAASAYAPAPVAFGNVHVGANVEQALTITNTAPAGGYTEKLDGTLTSSGTGYTATGSFTGLGGGASNSTSLDVILNTTNTGTIGGTGTLTLYSDGSGIDGFGTTALPTQTVNVSGAVYALAAPVVSTTPNPTITPLVNFTAASGSNPLGNLIADAAGDLFGVADNGGVNGDGAVFEIVKTAGGYANTPTTLASFNVTDGENPIGNLIADGAGDLFGTTHGGGASGDGTVFEIAKTAGVYSSTPTVLASFNGANGQNPYAGLVADSAGDLFGTTLSGGGGNGTGTIFEIVKTLSGYASTPTTLFNFNDTNGGSPRATMIIDGAGDLFGTTIGGGSYGYGTVFELTKTVGGYTNPPTILANFSSGGIGDYPWSSLIEDAAGDLFGTTTQGNGGTVFEVVNTSTGYATGSGVMPTFLAAPGGFPIGNLTEDAAGNLFGTASQYGPDGTVGDGSVFEITKTGSGYSTTVNIVATFDGTNGDGPQYGLLADSSGDLFGTAVSGGASNDGTAFELNGSGFQTLGTIAVNFGAARVGGTAAAQTVTITNGTTATAYQESLVYNLLSGLPAGFTAGASDSGTIVAGGTATPTLLLNTSTAGDFIDSADTLTLVSTGVGTSGLANTNLTAPTLTLDGEVFATATASVSGNTINFGAVHVGQIVNAMTLGVTNAATGAVTDILVASSVTETGGYTGAVTPSLGTGLAAGAAGTVTFGLATTTVGLQNGTVDLGFLSRDGVLNDLTLAAVPITVAGAVFNYATASAATPNPVNFGEQHVGTALNNALSITNLGTVGGFTEKLDASIDSPTGSATASGAFTGLAASLSNGNSLTIGLNSAHDGAQSGTATIALTSDGAGVDALGTTPLAAQTITVEGTLYNYATASVASPNPVNFGEQHVGAVLSKALSITNLGTADGFTEKLDASIGSTTGSATANGSFTGLAAGITNSTSLVVDLNSGKAGVQSGTATVTVISDGAGVDTLGTTALTAQTVTVGGTLYNYATASAVSPNPVNFGIVHVGTAVSETLSISNLATAGSFSENLDASIGGATSGVTANGSFTGLGGSATNTTSLAVGLNTSTAGTISGMATIAVVSDGASIDTLGTTMLAAQTVTVSGTVNNYATATIEKISGGGTLTQAGTAYTLALGTIDLGASGPEINLGVINAATGPADLLGGGFTVSGDGGGAFINTLTAFSNVAAGNVASGEEVSLSSSTAGAFSETITLLANGSNSSGYLGALPQEVISVTGSVVSTARTLIWTGASDTNFANASNWDDITSGLNPATQAPTTTDTAEFNSGGTVITGAGTAAVLLFDGNGAWHLTSGASLTASGTVIVGSAVPTALLIDQGSSLIDAGSAVIANTTTASGSSVTVTGAGSDWGIAGTLEVGNAASGTLDIGSGATVSALDVTIGNASGLVSVGAGSELLIGAGGELTVKGTLANFGAVSGGGATEVAFGSGTDRLILGPAATFGGTVAGGGINSTIELAAGTGAGTLTGLGTSFTNFGTVIVDAGATWTVDAAVSLLATTTFIGNGALSTLALTNPGTFSLAGVSNFGTIDLAAGNNTVTVTDKTLSGAAVTINDGASGNNTVSAAGDTSASRNKSLTYNTGSGTDSFTGGFENDTVSVSAAAVAGDTLTGGSGTNTLVLTSAGVLNLAGVSKFATIDLAAGNSTVTVTDALLSGGALTINDGASGNNTVSAAGDTSASKNKMLTYNAGSGTDSFTGGFENDKVDVAAAAVGGDTLTGGSGTDTLVLTSAGAANLGGVSKFATIDLAAGNSTVTVTDTTLSGGSVTINDGASGNNSISAAGDTSASTGKTLVYIAGSGTDSFAGGFENDAVHVSAAAVGGDTLTGGNGANSLVLSSAGAASLGGVSKFGSIFLAAGNSTVTVTNTTLSGGTVTINDGASGNNSISAAGDTSASTGKTLKYFTGAGTDSFTGGFENDSIQVSAAAVGGDTLTGGSGTNSLTLSSAGAANLGGVSKFGNIFLAAGNSTVTVADKTLSGGTVTINDGASGNNSISAAGDTSASTGKTLKYFTGAGTDSFTGGFEIDSIRVSAAAVAGDTLTGGSGANVLTLTTAGAVNLGGVSKFGTVFLAVGNSTVTVTNTTLAGGAVTINDAASGNNSISAAGDTSASTGKTLTYDPGTGTDSFTGNFENDTIFVSAAAVAGDTLTGGSSVINKVVLTSAGTVNLGGISEFPTVDLAAGNSTVTVTDKTLSGGALTINDGASGSNTVSAAGDTSASTGKTLRYTTGAGTDSFTGGFEGDAVRVSAAAVGADTLTGGSAGNTLFLTTAGTANLGGVSKFATIDLANGNSTVTVADKTLSGGTVTINDGTSGNNTISAAGDTSASTGKTLAYFAGPGTDRFTGGFENDAVHVSAVAVGGDTLTGGSGTDTLVLTSAGAANLGGVSKFSNIFLAAGSSTVTVTNTTLSGGSVTINDGASGSNSVSAAGDTSASTGKTLKYFTGTGTDSFTGGFENDSLQVSAAAVGGDTLTGGSGANTLTLSSAGAANLGGVSKFGTINLAVGNSTVTVTDKTLSGGAVTINDAASGNNTISAAGDTSASTGKSLSYHAGSGTNGFTGGFENDTIYAGTGSGTYTAGSGTDSFVFIKSSLPSQTLNNFQVSTDDILVYGTHSAGGFDLGSTDNALNPTTPTAISLADFVSNASGDFTASTQRFAYDTTNGNLFYSATGSNTSESLVANLTGEPGFTASNLLFEH